MNKIIAIDFDGTLCESNFPDIGLPKIPVIARAIVEQKNGAFLILNTMREGSSLDEAVTWCKKYNLIFDAINDNAPERQRMFNNNSRKIYADEYWDDHNIFIDGVN